MNLVYSWKENKFLFRVQDDELFEDSWQVCLENIKKMFFVEENYWKTNKVKQVIAFSVEYFFSARTTRACETVLENDKASLDCLLRWSDDYREIPYLSPRKGSNNGTSCRHEETRHSEA